MAFPPPNPSPSNSTTGRQQAGVASGPSNPYLPIHGESFDIFEWYPHFQSCVRYFIDKAQHTVAVQAVAALINIRLPFQQSHSSAPMPNMASAAMPGGSMTSRAGQTNWIAQQNQFATLNPYIRRLVATGWDTPEILHGFFGDDWALGVSHIHEVERRNYLFAAKSANWLEVKSLYDMNDEESIPYLRPLQNVTEKEIVSAETNWSEWLAMQDWMVGPRALEVDINGPVQENKDGP